MFFHQYTLLSVFSIRVCRGCFKYRWYHATICCCSTSGMIIRFSSVRSGTPSIVCSLSGRLPVSIIFCMCWSPFCSLAMSSSNIRNNSVSMFFCVANVVAALDAMVLTFSFRRRLDSVYAHTFLGVSVLSGSQSSLKFASICESASALTLSLACTCTISGLYSSSNSHHLAIKLLTKISINDILVVGVHHYSLAIE
jgi:hypothetical protein